MNIDDNGTTGPYTHVSHDLVVQASGDFGGGTLAFQVALGATFVTEHEFTEAGQQIFELVPGCRYQYVLSGATSPDINVDEKAREHRVR